MNNPIPLSKRTQLSAEQQRRFEAALRERGMTPRSDLEPEKPTAQVPQPIRVVDTSFCPLCKDVGWLRANKPLGHPDFGKAVKCQCKQDQGERVQRADNRLRTYRWLGQPEALALEMEAMTFESFRVKYRSDAGPVDFTEAFRESRNYADAIKAQAKGQRNVLYLGTYGVGKTHLAGAILNTLRDDGVACLFTTAPGLFKAIYAADFPQQQQIILAASTTPLLVLDDLDKLYVKQESNPNVEAGAYQKSILFDLLDARYVAKLPTIITTNAEGDLKRWLDKAVISRLFGNMLPIKMVGQDYRQIAFKK